MHRVKQPGREPGAWRRECRGEAEGALAGSMHRNRKTKGNALM